MEQSSVVRATLVVALAALLEAILGPYLTFGWISPKLMVLGVVFAVAPRRALRGRRFKRATRWAPRSARRRRPSQGSREGAAGPGRRDLGGGLRPDLPDGAQPRRASSPCVRRVRRGGLDPGRRAQRPPRLYRRRVVGAHRPP